MRKVLIAVIALALAGCSIVYRLPTRQGNVIDQPQFEKLALGQTREQVRYLLGTPVATSPFQNDRWEYLGYYKDPRGKVSSRTIKLYFESDKLARMEGVQIAGVTKPLDTPDVDRIIKEKQPEAAEKPGSASAGDQGDAAGANPPAAQPPKG